MAQAKHFAPSAEAADPGPGRVRGGWRYWLAYTGGFLALGLFVFWLYWGEGNSVCWAIDGTCQYFPLFVYEGKWLRAVVASLVAGAPHLPQWSWSLGMGADTIYAIYEQLFDPFNLVSVFFAPEVSEYAYQALLFVRQWVCGWAFSLFSLRRGNGRFATLLGALAYAFSITVIKDLLWPGAFVGAIAMPLMLLGARKVFEGERPWVLVATTLYLFGASPYFAYMVMPFFVAYCAWSAWHMPGGREVRTFTRWVGRILWPVLLGVLISSAAFVPTCIGLLDTSRTTDAEVSVPVLYTLRYYKDFVFGLAGEAIAGSDCYVGYGALTVLAAVLLATNAQLRRENRALVVTLAITTVMLCVPAAGSALNGFNYATNRWVFVYALIVSYVLVRAVPALAGERGQVGLRALVVAAAIYVLATAVRIAIKDLFITQLRAPIMASVAFVVCMAALLLVRRWPRVARPALLAVLAFCLAGNAWCYARFEIYSYTKWGHLWDEIANSPISNAQEAATQEGTADVIERVDVAEWTHNFGDLGLPLGVKSFGYYVSVYNSAADEFMAAFGIPGSHMNVAYSSLGNNGLLEALCSTRYLVARSVLEPQVAWGFDEAVLGGVGAAGDLTVYRSDVTVPFGFTTAYKISREAFNEVGLAARQDAVAEGVVLETTDYEASGLAEREIESEARNADYEVTSTEDCTIDGNTIIVTSEKGGMIALAVEGSENCEFGVEIRNVSFSGSWQGDRTTLAARLGLEAESTAQAWTYHIGGYVNRANDSMYLTNYGPGYYMYGGKRDWYINLGAYEEAPTEAQITFTSPGVYTFDEINLIEQPLEGREERLDALRAETLQDVEVESNTVRGTIEVSETKALVLTIPWAAGWSATVDGEKAQIMRADVGFMAIELEPGEHAVVLTYQTPGILAGAVLSGVGLVCLVVIGVYRRHHAQVTA